MLPGYVAALFAHWVADFPLQAIGHRHMGQKATRLTHLLNHVVVYFFAFWVIWWLYEPFALRDAAFVWICANALLHGAIDYWTSKATAHHYRAWLYQHDDDLLQAERHNTPVLQRTSNYRLGSFFTIIGFDQFLHVAFLLWSGYALGVL